MDSLNISGLTNYVSNIAASDASNKLAASAKNAQTDDQLMEACKEFETYLWEQVLHSMTDTVNIAGEGTSSQMVDYFMDTTLTEVASNLTEQSKGPGSLAMQMYEQMKRTSTIDVASLLSQATDEAKTNTDAV